MYELAPMAVHAAARDTELLLPVKPPSLLQVASVSGYDVPVHSDISSR
jgi:hypothetical protein